jgi:hypothetical protein
MKKETIEKLFRRYIGIYDDVVFRTTGEHISENEINIVNAQVDQLFKEYEHVETLNDFTQFTKKIQEILTNTIESASKLNKEQREKALNEIYWKFNNDPEKYIQKEVDETINKIIPDAYGDYYIPDNPYLDIAASKGYNTPFRLDKIQEHIKEIDPKWKNAQLCAEEINNDEYKNKLEEVLLEINKYPIQFCEETIKKYFYDNNLLILSLFKNNIKNEIIIDIINSKLIPHTEQYEKELNLLFKSKESFIFKTRGIQITNEDLKNKFLDNLVVRNNVIGNFLNIWKILIFENKNLSKHDKNNLLKKYNIIKNNHNKLTDASIIRFNTFVNNFNGGGSVNFKRDFTASFSDKSYLPMIINLVDAELTVLINELETVKFDKDAKSFVLDNNYSNIINDYYKYLGDIKLSKNNNSSESYIGRVLNEQENAKVEKEFNKQMNKINILYSLVEEFNKQYRYKYIMENIKSKFKNIIKIK